MARALGSLALGVALLGCATPYQPAGFRGGYSDHPLPGDRFYVSFEGNGYTSHGTVVQSWHRRASELCGGPYEVLSQGDLSREQLIVTNTMATNVRKPGIQGVVQCARAEAPQEPAAVVATTGTCFAISPDGLILTAQHVVAGASTIEVRFGRDTWVAAEAVASNANDIVLLQVDRPAPGFLPLVSARSASLGQPVFTVGFPAEDVLGSDAKFTDGTISALSGLGGEASLLQVSVPIQPGSSGGPLVTDSGEVVGVITATAAVIPFASATGTLPQNVNWAVKSDYAMPLVESLPAQPRTKTRDAAIRRAVDAACAVRATR